MSAGFQTQQTPRLYDEALARHAQYVRWMKAIPCACLVPSTKQPDPNCSVCRGRGRFYRPPGTQRVLQEETRRDFAGTIRTKYSSVVPGSAVVWHQGKTLSVDPTPLSDGSIALQSPLPPPYARLFVDYEFSPVREVIAENSEVVHSPWLRTLATQRVSQGRTVQGTVTEVHRVYNVTRDETLDVDSISQHFIRLDDLGNWQQGDQLEVDYSYVEPFRFLLTGISEKMRYERAYVSPQADALLMAPHFTKISHGDVFTALSAEQRATHVFSPGEIVGESIFLDAYYDIARIDEMYSAYGVLIPSEHYELRGRNEIVWLVDPPHTKCSVIFTYHPTFVAFMDQPSLRAAEDKAFVIRINLTLYNRTSAEESI